MAGKKETMEYLNKIIPENANVKIELRTYSRIEGRAGQRLMDEFPYTYYESLVEDYRIEVTMDKKFNLPTGE